MEESADLRKWDELLPDALGLIFKNLSLREVLTVVPRVCKSWEAAVSGPYCWQEIDIEEWSKNAKPETIDRMLRLLITRSSGSVRKLSVSLASKESFTFIANHAQSLHALKLTRSEINDQIIESAAPKLSSLTYLDLSDCMNLGAQALKALGKNCASLTKLRRVMHPLEVIDQHSRDDEALAIALTMPELKHLEIAYLPVSTSSVTEILKNCKNLEVLDVRGCWNVDLDEKLLQEYPKLKVVGPLVVDCYDMNGWDICSDYSASSDYLAWDFAAGEIDEEFEDFMDDMMWEEEDYGDGGNVELWFYDAAL